MYSIPGSGQPGDRSFQSTCAHNDQFFPGDIGQRSEYQVLGARPLNDRFTGTLPPVVVAAGPGTVILPALVGPSCPFIQGKVRAWSCCVEVIVLNENGTGFIDLVKPAAAECQKQVLSFF